MSVREHAVGEEATGVVDRWAQAGGDLGDPKIGYEAESSGTQSAKKGNRGGSFSTVGGLGRVGIVATLEGAVTQGVRKS